MRKIIFQIIIFWFYVNLPGCRLSIEFKINPRKVIGHPQSLSDNMMPREKGAVFVFGGILFGFMLKDTIPFSPRSPTKISKFLTPPKTNYYPLKIDGWKMFFLKLLMQRILHQLICSLSRYSHWFCTSQVVFSPDFCKVLDIIP